jgi:hypothetical protein
MPMLMERNVFSSLVTLVLQDINFLNSLLPRHKEPLGDALLVILRARAATRAFLSDASI